jgi:HAD superfamily hydrolase (TIGR01549 family)
MAQPKGVLFDADDTLWYCSGWSGSRAWNTMLEEFGFRFEPEGVEVALKSAGGALASVWDALETRGTPARPEETRAYFRRVDKRVLDQLGVKRDQKSVIDRIEVWFSRFEWPTELFPDVASVLNDLRWRNLRMGMVSNGFDQRATARRIGIDSFFETIIDTGSTGYQKPMPEIYRLVLDALDIEPSEAVMTGDIYDWDVAGPEAIGIKCIHLVRDNSDSPVDKVIRDL